MKPGGFMSSLLQPGAAAPDFELANNHGAAVALASLRAARNRLAVCPNRRRR
jgi:peroxiredoxin